MDERIFAQLDSLDQSARAPRPDQHHYETIDNHHDEYPAFDEISQQYGEDQYHYNTPHEGYIEQPHQLDPFDEHLLHQPDHDSRHAQAVLGRARLSLPSSHSRNTRGAAPYAVSGARGPASLSLSRFALDSTYPGPSSSPIRSRHPSSPTYGAAQRRPSQYYEESLQEPREEESWANNSDRAIATYQQQNYDEPDMAEDELPTDPLRSQAISTQPSYAAPPRIEPRAKSISTPPVVQGISLISTRELPDRFRAIFPFPLLNAVQSKCFPVVYKTNDNFVVSAPTGSGKTAILELAICRLINGYSSGSFKIVYQAPTKSLCSERQRDWQAKFGPLDLQVAELTGDTDNAQLRHVQHASIIVTTPEKWDSMTRKWKDHQKLMQMVKLFLIDEVHILKEDRGATLEAVVSRMKSIGSDVRFVALSATVPNGQDIATWLGKDSVNQQIPAPRERFGEEFRPVRLDKRVCGYNSNSNDFAFEKILNAKLTDVIAKWSQHKPIMVFCFTRAACVETAKLLTNWWVSKGPAQRFWTAPRSRVVVADKDLRDTISAGVAFHHAGLGNDDRAAIEKGYLAGDINVICCTSTLAVGVNLPCHMVIIKGTVTYTQTGGCKEYSDLEIMQMLGRAGRPQFDNTAVAVIMTRLPKVPFYEKLVTGQELLESCLHLNLIDHLNAEIGLGTVTNVFTAKNWLSGTFLYVRLKENPQHYQIEGDSMGNNLDERLGNICQRAIQMLEDHDLIRGSAKLQSTEFGDAMARYYLQFHTMKNFLALPPKAKISEILSAVSQAAEFREVRFRSGEKPAYKELNKNNSIKFPIPVNIDVPAHKVSLIIQSVLGAVELSTTDMKHRNEYNTSKFVIFQHIHRLIRCIIDCQLYLEDAVSAKNALMLARSFGAQVWDDSPLHIKQLEGIGLVSVRKLVAAGMKSIEDVEASEPHQIERALSRNPPFGAQVQQRAKEFPRLRIGMQVVGEPTVVKGESVAVKIRAEIGFMNEKIPEFFNRRPVYVCLLAETSDGHKVHFARISAKKLNRGQEVLFSVDLKTHGQVVRGFVMCDEIAGTQRTAMVKPEIPAFLFPAPKTAEQTHKDIQSKVHAPNTSKRRASTAKHSRSAENDDEFGDADIDDAALAAAAEGDGFANINDFDDSDDDRSAQKTSKKSRVPARTQSTETREPRQLENGKWACNHKCGDKSACKHLCCREGLDNKPKPPKPKDPKKSEGSDPKQRQLDLTQTKQSGMNADSMSTSGAVSPPAGLRPLKRTAASKEVRDLDRIHSSIKTATPRVPLLKANSNSRSFHRAKDETQGNFLSFMQSVPDVKSTTTSDYGLGDDDDMLDFAQDELLSAEASQSAVNTYAKPSAAADQQENIEPYSRDSRIQGLFITGNTSSSDLNHSTVQNADSLDYRVPATKHCQTDDLFDEPSQFPTSSKKQKMETTAANDDYAMYDSPFNDATLFDDPPSAHESFKDGTHDDTTPDHGYLPDAEGANAPPDEKIATTQSKSDANIREWFEREFGTEHFELTD